MSNAIENWPQSTDDLLKFYFTYGSDQGGGWSVVMADTVDRAYHVFKLYHPMTKDGLLPYSGILTEDDFKKSEMYKRGTNFGVGTREVIALQRWMYDELKGG